MDVKENKRGRFIKIAEVGRSDGRKNQIMMSLRTAAQFRQHLVMMTENISPTPFKLSFLKFEFKLSMIEFSFDLSPVDPNNLHQGKLKSETMIKDDKKYHLDLKVAMHFNLPS